MPATRVVVPRQYGRLDECALCRERLEDGECADLLVQHSPKLYLTKRICYACIEVLAEAASRAGFR